MECAQTVVLSHFSSDANYGKQSNQFFEILAMDTGREGDECTVNWQWLVGVSSLQAESMICK